ncbi:hypothetical protein RI543_001311 [Arxiozyma heterogenica]|uniref:DNA repair protein RAD4 n=1 Tax=Arxiozyma heterogenica TaxID=278026 RepID=A0AAN7W4V1_9SACH|nr:hypothetical protein RI543_001311 [Kazachstania heterogenica]
MSQDLTREQFDLIRKVLKEKKEQGISSDNNIRPRKKRKRSNKNESILWIDKSPSCDTVVLDSESSGTEMEIIKEKPVEEQEEQEDGDGDEEFDSEEFEDVLFDEQINKDDDMSGDLNITINNLDNTKEVEFKKQKEKRARLLHRNIVSNDVRQFRKEFHFEYLLCLLIHGHLRNEWLNDDKLLNKLYKKRIISEKVQDLLHPTLDLELPLRSTRKLLDGLKQSMQLWIKHCRVIKPYNGVGLYMRHWDEIKTHYHNHPMTKSQFIKAVTKGCGNRDILSQGFVALLRAYQVNARLCFSCQPPDLSDMKLKSAINSQHDNSDKFKFPIFWCEVWDKFSKKWITIDPMNFQIIEQVRNVSKLEPDSSSTRNLMRYVIAYDRKQGCRDVSRRYVKQMHSYKFRHGRATNDQKGSEWYSKVLKRLTLRKRIKIDDYEDLYFEDRDEMEGMPTSLQDFKNHPKYILEKDIKTTQYLVNNAKECGYLRLNNKKQPSKVLKVFLRKDVIDLKTPRQWYQLGRVLKSGARFKKTVKKKDNIGVRLKDSDNINDDGIERLYSIDDTELYEPPNANELGEIKKNTYGNIEVFTPSMIPRNCCLIENPNSIRACKFLRIEYAPAVTTFNFQGKRRMGKGNVNPVITGVVVAKWFKDAVIATIEGIEYSLEQDVQRAEQLKHLQDWNDMLLRLKIKSNLIETYGVAKDDEQDYTANQDSNENDSDAYVEPGGFLPAKVDQINSENFSSNLATMENNQVVGSGEEKEEEEDDDDKNDEVVDEDINYDEYEAFMDELEA